jgi:DNA mismatch repair ATPase MutS
VRYCLLIKGSTIKVRKFEAESDYAGEVAAIFARFAQAAGRDYRATFPAAPSMNHVEAQILQAVAQLHADVFGELDHYCAANSGFLDAVISRFDREIQFYVAYLDYMALFGRMGLKFCYPQVSATDKETFVRDAFDLALAYKLLGRAERVVCNDFHLSGGERILIISGPNQGGKTTFARACGQLHYLASLGCPVAARQAQVFLCDNIFTHFESEENIANLRGKLADDLVRIHAVLQQATPRSLIILNEIFSSTTLRDAILLGKRVMAAIVALDLLCVCVTFLDELAAFGPTTVSMVSTVDAHDGATRTYRIVRKPADGRAYAVSIAEKHRLTYENLLERIQP